MPELLYLQLCKHTNDGVKLNVYVQESLEAESIVVPTPLPTPAQMKLLTISCDSASPGVCSEFLIALSASMSPQAFQSKVWAGICVCLPFADMLVLNHLHIHQGLPTFCPSDVLQVCSKGYSMQQVPLILCGACMIVLVLVPWG